jgi:hypothetical protein
MALLKKVMSLINKTQGSAPNNSNTLAITQSIFTKEELEFLLITLKEGTFKGAQLEMMYNTVLKLQQEYAKINR